MKEINQLKNQSEYLTRIKMHGYKFIDVKFYDATELLNKDMRELINGKIKQMRDQYELSLIDMQERNKYLQQQIHVFKKLEKEGNVGIRFDDMHVDKVIGMVSHLD